MKLKRLLDVAEELGARRASEQHAVFRLSAGLFRWHVGARQTAFLAELLEVDASLYWTLEEPPGEFDSQVAWPQVTERVWTAPAGVPAGELRRRWLYTGNWMVFIGRSPTISIPWIDPFRTPPDRLVEFLRTAGLDFLLASFHDDLDWRIAFGTAG